MERNGGREGLNEIEFARKTAGIGPKRIGEPWSDESPRLFAEPVEVHEACIGGRRKNMPKAELSALAGHVGLVAETKDGPLGHGDSREATDVQGTHGPTTGSSSNASLPLSLDDPLPNFFIDCRDNLDFMAECEDGAFKLIVTSPPYNLGKSYENRSGLDVYLGMQERVIGECARLLHERGSICWQVGNYVDNGEIVPLDALLYPIFRAQGLKLRNRIVWHFGHGLHCTKRLSGRYETINWWTKGDDYTWHLDPIRVPSKYPNKKHFKGPNAGKLSGNPRGKNPSDVWQFPNVKSNHPEKTIHPCQFPVELVERLVLSMTDEGDAVFDPYMGVGSAVIAALKHGRAGYGCDIVEEYVEIARERIGSLEAGSLVTRPMGKPIYDPSLPRGGH